MRGRCYDPHPTHTNPSILHRHGDMAAGAVCAHVKGYLAKSGKKGRVLAEFRPIFRGWPFLFSKTFAVINMFRIFEF